MSLLHPEKSLGTLGLLYLQGVVPTLLGLPRILPSSFPKGTAGVLHVLKNATAILEPESMPDGDLMVAHLRATMAVTCAVLPVLARHDEATLSMLKSVPQGILQIKVPDAELSVWIEWSQGVLKSGYGEPTRAADSLLIFKNNRTAYLAFSKKLDELAAIGAGDLVLVGMVPLADGLNAVMDRVAYYLK